jgi:HAE1 family hydrophobic/amphiphilic exporter-1
MSNFPVARGLGRQQQNVKLFLREPLALEAQRNEGESPAQAIQKGCLIRFRPITMTTMATQMGSLPIALGFGAGAESRRPLGLAVAVGLLFYQLLTLYITSVVYTYMESFQGGVSRLSLHRNRMRITEHGLARGQ